MAITVVQHTSTTNAGANTTSYSLAYGSSVTAGNLLIVCIGAFTTTVVSVPTDTLGNTYVLAASNVPPATSSPSEVYIYYAVANGSGANTVSTTFDAAHACHLHIREISGVDTLDQSGSNFQSGGTTAATVSTSGATTVAAEYVIAFFGQDNAASTWTVGTNYTNLDTTPNAAHGSSAASEDRILAATGTQTATATASLSDLITGAIATFYLPTVSTKQYCGLLGVGT